MRAMISSAVAALALFDRRVRWKRSFRHRAETAPPRVSPVSVAAPVTSTSTHLRVKGRLRTRSTASPTTSATTSPAPSDVRRGYPFAPSVNSSYGGQHHDYPAADIFAACRPPIRSVVSGTVVDVSPTNRYDARVDDPATRGGIFLAVEGDDGVRYYMAHLRALAPSIAVGRRVALGDPIGEVAGPGGPAPATSTSRSRRRARRASGGFVAGAIWPQRYLDSWRAGGNLSPVDEVRRFLADNPHACESPGAMPWPST